MPLTQFPNSPAPAQDFVQTPAHFPEVPGEILQRFSSAQAWNDELTLWYKQLVGALGDQQDSVTSVVNANDQTLGNVVVQQGEMTAEIETIQQTIINNYGVLAQRIVTVSALAGTSSHISVQNTAPVGPALNDLWVDNTVTQTPVTYKWNGAAWVEVTVPISVAAVAAEQTARITADGFLEGKYTLTVIAGNVVTGMNITSSTGTGTDVSSVIFRATDFQIYNGVSGVTMFSVSGSNVNLAGVLTVSTSGRVFTGTGTYGASNTPFYVDSSSNFSLGNKLTWNGTTLTISGSITATSGTIGGWTINASTISSNNAVLDSAGQLFLGTANNVVYLSATDATYRLWVGNVTAGSAAFSVTKAGVMTATGGVFSGTITSTSGTIGGFTLGPTSLTGGTGLQTLKIDTTGGLVLGNAAATRAVIYSDTINSIVGFAIYNSSNIKVADLFLDTSAGPGDEAGGLTLYDKTGVAQVSMSAGGTLGAISADNYIGGSFSGTGSSLTSLNATNIASGTINNSRLPTTISIATLFLSAGLTMTNSSNTPFDITNGTVTFRSVVNNGTSRANWGTTTNHSVEIFTNNSSRFFFGSDGNFKTVGGDFRKVTSDAWTPILYDGTNQIELQASGGQIFGRINGGGAILLG